MVELRAILLPDTEPLRLPRGPGAFADASLRPLARGLVFLAALSLPVLGCTFADWFHGRAPRATQVVAVPLTPPQNGTAAKFLKAEQATTAPARQAMLMPAKFAQSLSLQ